MLRVLQLQYGMLVMTCNRMLLAKTVTVHIGRLQISVVVVVVHMVQSICLADLPAYLALGKYGSEEINIHDAVK